MNGKSHTEVFALSIDYGIHLMFHYLRGRLPVHTEEWVFDGLD